MNSNEESTYALIVRSEEKSRTALEVVMYACLAVSVVFSIYQFAHQPVVVPAAGLTPSSDIAMVTMDSGIAARA